MINKEENNKIENIKNLENMLNNKVVSSSVVELRKAKDSLDIFCEKLAEKFNSIKVAQIEEAKEKERLEKEKQKAEFEQQRVQKQQMQQMEDKKPFVRFDKSRQQDRNFNGDRQNFSNRNFGEKRFSNDDRRGFNKPFQNQNKPFGDKPFVRNGQGNGPKPFAKPGVKPQIKQSYAAPLIDLKEKERTRIKKKPTEPTQEKKVMNKKAQFKMSLVNDDLNESESVKYRRVKTKKEKVQEQVITVVDKAVMDTETISFKDLSEKIGKPVAEIVKKLFILGIMSTINSSIDFDTAELVCSEFGVTLEYKKPESFEEKLSKMVESEDDSNMVRRAPVVTVMGHVDHGKTSLLDAIRKTNVIGGEAGGITQHIGAYTVKVGDRMITFIDTPGHAAFTAMRERGANITDVAILVVAADDGLMPQTLEAIKHIKNANVPMVVAINKIDKPTANVEKVKQQLADQGVLSDEWGGDTIMVPISAKQNMNIDKLLEMVLLQADVLDLKADPTQKATGSVIEAKIDKGKGPVATILIQNGTLHVGDTMVVGLALGRIRAMIDEHGKNVKSAGPSTPISVLGLDAVPLAGDKAYVVDEKLSKQLIEERKTKLKRDRVTNSSGVSAEDLFHKAEDNMKKQLNVIVKADVQGSCEALKESILEIQSEEVKVNVISATVGNVSETDADLAKTTNSIIICFNTKADNKARDFIEKEKVEIYYSRVIYDVIDFLTDKMKSMFAPKFNEIYTGSAEVRMVYKITGVGIVAGSIVLDGKISRGALVKVLRGKEEIGSYKLESLKIKKDDVKEVGVNFECGIRLEGFEKFEVGDKLMAYNLERVIF